MIRLLSTFIFYLDLCAFFRGPNLTYSSIWDKNIWGSEKRSFLIFRPQNLKFYLKFQISLTLFWTWNLGMMRPIWLNWSVKFARSKLMGSSGAPENSWLSGTESKNFKFAASLRMTKSELTSSKNYFFWTTTSKNLIIRIFIKYFGLGKLIIWIFRKSKTSSKAKNQKTLKKSRHALICC